MSSSIDHSRPRGHDAIRFRRGTRGFAAVVTALNGFVVLAVGAVVLPSTRLSELGFGWAIPLVVVAGPSISSRSSGWSVGGPGVDRSSATSRQPVSAWPPTASWR